MIDVCLNYHSSCTFNFRLLSAIALSKTKFLNFGWPLNRGKDNNETLIGSTKMVAAEVTGQWVFYLQYLLTIILDCIDNSPLFSVTNIPMPRH